MASQPPPKKDYNRNTRQFEERTEGAGARSGAKADMAAATEKMTGVSGLAAKAAAARARSASMPRRADFADEATYEKARERWRAGQDSTPEAEGQKRALKSLK